MDRPTAQNPTNCDEVIRTVLDGTTDAIAIHRDGKVVYVNPAGLSMFGYERADQVLGRSPMDFVAAESRELVARRIFNLGGGGPAELEVEERMIDAKGVELPVEVVAFPVFFEGDLATLVHIRDIRARKDLEAKLRAADRLAHVGFVAAAVMHEIRNPLAYALVNSDLLADRLTGESREMLNNLHEGLLRIRDVVRDVGIFSGAIIDEPTALDLHAVLDSVANLVRFELSGRAHLVKRYGKIPHVFGTRSKLGHVFANILINAAQAIPPGDEAGNEVTIVTSARDDDVIVEIHDTGAGIAAESLSRIFEPFFTTKETGTGLGLAISRKLIEAEGGSIAVCRRDVRGTTFIITLRGAGGATPA